MRLGLARSDKARPGLARPSLESQAWGFIWCCIALWYLDKLKISKTRVQMKLHMGVNVEVHREVDMKLLMELHMDLQICAWGSIWTSK